ncbi:MAG TPA: hypothetical protein VKF81_14530 [Blastocatellia bacterium]|nr:hypothetical protein [Blastocatellia bacterium]
MPKTQRLLSGLMLLILCSIATAQTETARIGKSSEAIVTASASRDRVRFAAPSSVVQIRLEVYDSAGKKRFDNEVRGGIKQVLGANDPFWDVNVEADDTNDALVIKATGVGSTTIRWVATVRTVEVQF